MSLGGMGLETELCRGGTIGNLFFFLNQVHTFMSIHACICAGVGPLVEYTKMLFEA